MTCEYVYTPSSCRRIPWVAVGIGDFPSLGGRVGQLDTSELDEIHPNDGPGGSAYDPRMMCALLLYAYMSGVRFGPTIEQACGTDAAYRVICGGLCPDHSMIAAQVDALL